MLASLRSWFVAALLLALAAAGHAACAPRLEIAFADGSKACLTDFALAEQRPLSGFAALHRQMPPHATYELALPRRPSMCPSAVSLWTPPNLSPNSAQTTAVLAASLARRNCQQVVGVAAAGAACECVAVLANGSSPLTRADFERLSTEAAAPASMALDATWNAQATAPTSAALSAPAAEVPAETPATTGCQPRHLLRFADGSRACLTEFALADRRPVGQVAALRNMVPSSGAYHVAVPEAGGSCQPVIGFTYTQFLSIQSMAAGASTAERAANAVAECQRAGRGDRADANCRCKLVIEEGQSTLTRQQFAAVAAAPATTAGATGSLFDRLVAAVAEPKPTSPAPAMVKPSTPGPAPVAVQAPAPALVLRVPPSLPPALAVNTVATLAPLTTTTVAPAAVPLVSTLPAAVTATGPSAGEMATLRQQIEALQTQMARQAAVVAPAAPVKPAPARMRTRALVVGNGAYASLGALPNPRRDAEAIAAKLRGFGIEVDLVVDADRNALVKALADYQNRAAGYDVNILFYAGHGVQIGGINYIVPVDMAGAGASVGSVKLTAVALNDALEYLPARTRVVFLDACRDNPLSRSLMATRSAASLGLAPVNTSSGTLVAYATKDGSVAEDGSGRNSPYTTALLQHLDADEDIAVVLRRVRQAVLQSTGSRQEPWEYGSLVGDQLIVSRMSRP